MLLLDISHTYTNLRHNMANDLDTWQWYQVPMAVAIDKPKNVVPAQLIGSALGEIVRSFILRRKRGASEAV